MNPRIRPLVPLPVVLLALLAACGDDGAPANASTDIVAVPDAADTGSDTGEVLGDDADLGDATAEADGADTVDDGADTAGGPGLCGGTGATYTYLVSQLRFARLEGNVAQGLDLDGRDSDFRDDAGCRAPDAVSPDGRQGIDNNFATLLPALEQIGGDAIEYLIQQAIDTGRLLIYMQFTFVDDFENDDCVHVQIGRADGIPSVGTNGEIEPGQTFDYHPELLPVDVGQAAIVNGAMSVGTFDFNLPVTIFDTFIDLTAQQSTVVAEFGAQNGPAGFLAGALPLSDIFRIADRVVTDQNTVAAVIRELAPTFTDLYPDENGDCQAISVALLFETTPSFFYANSRPASGVNAEDAEDAGADEGSE